MSQKKVDQYKKEKANRKEILKKQKMKNNAVRALGVVICAALLGWAGYSGYHLWENSRPAVTTEIDTNALTEYLGGLQS
ncbi:MAG: hypothetical protein HFI77_10910 [Lachnospiraceae bacterium]|jgi:hypothetical protein|uniref:hypothetical protein n=1 Tax=Roseburia sp. 1XD42-69 TaxID=2320088 RepID=UPI000EA01B60|nr:hypothetical protein [Roseburia sp. 1XD42-69]MCI8876514.1 hypothetical protein [Lachnospiraceae bacterium]MCX4320165.1 hypothetical protein [Lachnospiraceae bacterium]RKJ62273.1 hypothetical protein D7Y06_17825 [Roseburia sp. 1XD42-69]